MSADFHSLCTVHLLTTVAIGARVLLLCIQWPHAISVAMSPPQVKLIFHTYECYHNLASTDVTYLSVTISSGYV